MRAKGRDKGDKGQPKGSKAGQGKARGRPGGKPEGRPETGLGLPGVPLVPGIIRSWEDFSEAALRDYLEEAIEQISEDLDEQERAFRSLN